MARQSNANYSILVDVELQTESIKKQLNESVVKLKKETDKAKMSEEDLTLTWQQSAEIMDKALSTIENMVEQVYKLNAATIEFQKVSDLSGQQLDDYVQQLSDLGSNVARTGKPLCLSRNVQMVNVH